MELAVASVIGLSDGPARTPMIKKDFMQIARGTRVSLAYGPAANYACRRTLGVLSVKILIAPTFLVCAGSTVHFISDYWICFPVERA